MMTKDLAKIEAVKTLELNDIVIVIGDGYTDYEIKKYGHASIFIAYIEHVNRENVTKFADYMTDSFDDIISYLNKL